MNEEVKTCAACRHSRGELRCYLGVGDFVELMCHHPQLVKHETNPIDGDKYTLVSSCRSLRLKPDKARVLFRGDREDDFNDCPLWEKRRPPPPSRFSLWLARVRGDLLG